MKYKKSELEKLALKAIKKHNLIYIEEVCSFLPCSNRTFYNYKLQELQTIKDAIFDVKVSLKAELRREFKKGSSAERIALYKLAGNEDELNRLNNNEVSKNEKRKQIVLTPKKDDEE